MDENRKFSECEKINVRMIEPNLKRNRVSSGKKGHYKSKCIAKHDCSNLQMIETNSINNVVRYKSNDENTAKININC